MIRKIDLRIKLAVLLGLSILCLFLQEPFTLALLFMLLAAVARYQSDGQRLNVFKYLPWLLFPLLAYIITRSWSYTLEWLAGVLRIAILFLTGWLFAVNTSGQEIVRLLDRWRAPRTVSFTLALALRFMPVVTQECQAIWDSVRLRGFKLTWSTVLRQHHLLTRALFIPLVVRSLQLSDEAAAAAEIRGFTAPFSKTSLYPATLKKMDYVFSALFLLVVSILYLAGQYLRRGGWAIAWRP